MTNDITMCTQNKCTRRRECLRYCAIPHPTYQAYSDFELCANDHAEFYGFRDIPSPVIRPWRIVDQEIADSKSTGEKA